MKHIAAVLLLALPVPATAQSMFHADAARTGVYPRPERLRRA